MPNRPLKESLAIFYSTNNLEPDGGYSSSTFTMVVFGISFPFPNPAFRKEVIHLHDIAHIIHKKDISWKGEAFISGWEIATRFWKVLPVGLFSLWAMGYSLWMYPKAVFKGFCSGYNAKGIQELKCSKEALLNKTTAQIKKELALDSRIRSSVSLYLYFLFWVLFSQVIFIVPFLLFFVFTYKIFSFLN